MTKYKVISVFFCVLLINSADAKVVQFLEDAYSMQAPKEIVDITERVAALMEFKDVYEVIIPKKAGIQINPWNRFVAHGINPQTKNPVIVVNPQWFLKMPQDQQTFLLGLTFENFKQGTVSFSMKCTPYLFLLLSILAILLLFWGLGKTRLANQKKIIRFFIALGIVFVCNKCVINTLHIKLAQYLRSRNDTNKCEMVLQKTLNRDAAIKTYECLDASMKDEFEKGETFFAPHLSFFKNKIDRLKK